MLDKRKNAIQIPDSDRPLCLTMYTECHKDQSRLCGLSIAPDEGFVGVHCVMRHLMAISKYRRNHVGSYRYKPYLTAVCADDHHLPYFLVQMHYIQRGPGTWLAVWLRPALINEVQQIDIINHCVN